MKVFISWSGTQSKKIALLFRDWLPTVIQALEPFVSSEDIDKGARWSTDIAQELRDSAFGIICVTKDNLSSSWLNFEAGALSKSIDNNYVAPILFGVKPSDLKDSPISQFQATSFSQEDMKRLIETLNAAAGNCLAPARLNKAFELCYPDLEKSIEELKKDMKDDEEEAGPDNDQIDTNLLEELLEMTRNTQRLIGNTDTKLYSNLEQLQKKTEEIYLKVEKQSETELQRPLRVLRSRYIDEMLFSPYARNAPEGIFPYNILILLSMFKREFPWLYDAGRDLVRIIQSNVSEKEKAMAIQKFTNLLEYVCENPMFRNVIGPRSEVVYMLREIPHILEREIMDRP